MGVRGVGGIGDMGEGRWENGKIRGGTTGTLRKWKTEKPKVKKRKLKKSREKK